MNSDKLRGGVALAATGPVKIPTDFQSSGGGENLIVLSTPGLFDNADNVLLTKEDTDALKTLFEGGFIHKIICYSGDVSFTIGASVDSMIQVQVLDFDGILHGTVANAIDNQYQIVLSAAIYVSRFDRVLFRRIHCNWGTYDASTGQVLVEPAIDIPVMSGTTKLFNNIFTKSNSQIVGCTVGTAFNESELVNILLYLVLNISSSRGNGTIVIRDKRTVAIDRGTGNNDWYAPAMVSFSTGSPSYVPTVVYIEMLTSSRRIQIRLLDISYSNSS